MIKLFQHQKQCVMNMVWWIRHTDTSRNKKKQLIEMVFILDRLCQRTWCVCACGFSCRCNRKRLFVMPCMAIHTFRNACTCSNLLHRIGCARSAIYTSCWDCKWKKGEHHRSRIQYWNRNRNSSKLYFVTTLFAIVLNVYVQWIL